MRRNEFLPDVVDLSVSRGRLADPDATAQDHNWRENRKVLDFSKVPTFLMREEGWNPGMGQCAISCSKMRTRPTSARPGSSSSTDESVFRLVDSMLGTLTLTLLQIQSAELFQPPKPSSPKRLKNKYKKTRPWNRTHEHWSLIMLTDDISSACAANRIKWKSRKILRK